MHLIADEAYVEPKEDDYPHIVGFRDNSADYCVILTRFSDLTPDNGTIEVIVRDQINTETANVTVEVARSHCRIAFDEQTASELRGVSEYSIDFCIEDYTYTKMVEILRAIFDGLPGLTVND